MLNALNKVKFLFLKDKTAKFWIFRTKLHNELTLYKKNTCREIEELKKQVEVLLILKNKSMIQ